MPVPVPSPADGRAMGGRASGDSRPLAGIRDCTTFVMTRLVSGLGMACDVGGVALVLHADIIKCALVMKSIGSDLFMYASGV